MSPKFQIDWGPNTPLLFSIEQTAELLGLSPGPVKNLLARQELVRRKVGARSTAMGLGEHGSVFHLPWEKASLRRAAQKTRTRVLSNKESAGDPMSEAELQTRQVREAAIRHGFSKEAADCLHVMRSGNGKFKIEFIEASEEDIRQLRPWIDRTFLMGSSETKKRKAARA
ncbi:MAG TPA: hypothetical protein VNV41_17110 [Candidatus Acidoferrales bacterium]|jgi:hypothetical protein|nr:hypothetical protein [Candidatus Acidoferrales bacterium]